jgi:hypothetical protein
MLLFESLQDTQLNLLIHSAHSNNVFLPHLIPNPLSSHALHPASRASELYFCRTNSTCPLDESGQGHSFHCTSGILAKCNIHNTKSKGLTLAEVEGTAPGLMGSSEAGLTGRVRHNLGKRDNGHVGAWLLAKAWVQVEVEGTRPEEPSVAGLRSAGRLLEVPMVGFEAGLLGRRSSISRRKFMTRLVRGLLRRRHHRWVDGDMRSRTRRDDGWSRWRRR